MVGNQGREPMVPLRPLLSYKYFRQMPHTNIRQILQTITSGKCLRQISGKYFRQLLQANASDKYRANTSGKCLRQLLQANASDNYFRQMPQTITSSKCLRQYLKGGVVGEPWFPTSLLPYQKKYNIIYKIK